MSRDKLLNPLSHQIFEDFNSDFKCKNSNQIYSNLPNKRACGGTAVHLDLQFTYISYPHLTQIFIILVIHLDIILVVHLDGRSSYLQFTQRWHISEFTRQHHDRLIPRSPRFTIHSLNQILGGGLILFLQHAFANPYVRYVSSGRLLKHRLSR